MSEEEASELWNELTDIIMELKDDSKGNRRLRRHVRDLEVVVNAIGQMLLKMSGKKGFLR